MQMDFTQFNYKIAYLFAKYAKQYPWLAIAQGELQFVLREIKRANARGVRYFVTTKIACGANAQCALKRLGFFAKQNEEGIVEVSW